MTNRSSDWFKQAERDLPDYPNGHPSGAPFEHYGTLQSSQAIEYAREILEFVRTQMA